MTRTRHSTVLALVLVLSAALLDGCNRNPGSGNGPGSAPTIGTTTSPYATGGPATGPTATPPARPTSGTTTPVTLAARVAYTWNWPNDSVRPGAVTHARTVPPLVELIRIGVGDHPREARERPYNRMSFTFAGGFPSYRFEFAERLISDGRGSLVPLRGSGVLHIVFTDARAHSVDGARSTIVSQPDRDLGMIRMVDYAAAGDVEGRLTYGIGIAWPNPHSNPQIAVRAYEVTRTTGGRNDYVVAVDVDAG